MKCVIKETMTENGKRKFVNYKEYNGYDSYLAISVKTGNPVEKTVDKDWILKHKEDIVNLGVSKDGNIYPVKPKGLGMKDTVRRWPQRYVAGQLFGDYPRRDFQVESEFIKFSREKGYKDLTDTDILINMTDEDICEFTRYIYGW